MAPTAKNDARLIRRRRRPVSVAALVECSTRSSHERMGLVTDRVLVRTFAKLGAMLAPLFTGRLPAHSSARVATAAVAAAALLLTGCGSATFCNAHGPSAGAAIGSYLRRCGYDYRISNGPYDADKATTGYASFPRVVEYTLNVKDNAEGSLAFLMVGQRTAGTPWRTLGPPGTGP